MTLQVTSPLTTGYSRRKTPAVPKKIYHMGIEFNEVSLTFCVTHLASREMQRDDIKKIWDVAEKEARWVVVLGVSENRAKIKHNELGCDSLVLLIAPRGKPHMQAIVCTALVGGLQGPTGAVMTYVEAHNALAEIARGTA